MTHARRPVTSGYLLRRVVDVARRHAYFVVALVMASLLLPLAAGALLSTGPTGDRNWYWANPQPQGNNLVATSWATTSTGYACGDNGTVLKSVDGGVTWTALDAGVTSNLTGISFVSTSTGWVVGVSGVVKKTTNGGSTWTTQTAPTTPAARNFRAVSALSASACIAVGDLGNTTSTIDYTTDGGTTWKQSSSTAAVGLSGCWMSTGRAWAVGANGTLLRSTDGGITWSVRTVATGLTAGLSAIAFDPTGAYGYLVGNAALPSWTIYKTSNNGNSWSAVTGLGSTGAVNLIGVSVLDANNAVAVGTNGVVRTTSDGGTTWPNQSQNGVGQVALRAVDMVDATHVRAVGDEGLAFYSNNDGAMWFSCGPSTTSAWYGSYFADANHGWVSGANGSIMKTTDAGTTWLQAEAGINNWRAIHFEDLTHGWVVGDAGTIWNTADGTNWTAQTSPSTQQLNGVWFTSLTAGVAVGNGGTILRTTNGTTWTAMPSGTTQNLYAVWFSDANNGWAVGAAGTVRATTNGGATWTTSTPGTSQALWAVAGVSATQVWASGDAGAVAKTVNGGTSWTTTASVNTTHSIRDISFADANNGWAAGTWGSFYKTTDGGSTWATEVAGVPTSTGDPERDVNAISSVGTATVYLAGSDGIVARSLDGAASWTSLQRGTLNALDAIAIPDDLNAWAGGMTGTLLHTSDGGLTWGIQRPGLTDQIKAIAMVDSRRGWLAGAHGAVRRTDNGGVSWTVQSSATASDLAAVASADGTHAILAGSGIVKYTTDSGSTWTSSTASQVPTQAVTGVSMTDATHAWAVTQRVAGNNVVWRTVDGGVTWASQPTTANANLWATSFVNNSLGFVAGDTGTILKTTDGGVTWTKKSTPTSSALYAIKFSDTNNGLAVGAGGLILRSTDSGQTWVVQSSGTARTLWAVGALGTGFGFIGGDLGTLLRSGDIVPPTTTLSQTPAQPTGTNGWYKATAPAITLSSSEAGSTYYSWTSASGPFTAGVSLTAIEGSTTLYYYSVDLSSNVETPKSAVFKVDLTPPTAPSTVSTTVVASSTAQVSWTPATDALSGVAYYNVFVNASWVSSTTATTAFLSGLTPASPCIVDIQTVDKAGNAAATNGTVAFITNAIITTPLTTQVAVVPSTPNGANGWYVTVPGIQLTTMPFGAAANTYYSWTGAAGSYALYSVGTTLTPLAGVSHLYVSTWDPTSVRLPEPTQTVTFAVDTQTPATPSVTATATGYQSIIATWPAVPDPPSLISHYDVYLNGSVYTSVTTNSVTVVGLAQQTTYTVSVIAASNAGAFSAASAPATAVTDPAPHPNAPAIVYAKGPGANYAYVNWQCATGTVGAVSYRIYRSFDGVTYSPVATNTGGLYDVTYVDTGLTPSSRYWYAVSTMDDRGEGSMSSTLPVTWPSIAPTTAGPDRPQGIMSFGASGTVAVEWSMESTAGITGYYVLRTPASLSTTITTLTPSPISSQAYIDHTAVNGETYYYSVRAIDATGDIGFPSLESEGKPQAPAIGTGLDPHVYGGGSGSCFCHSTHTSAGVGPQIRFPVKPPAVVCEVCHPPAAALGEFLDPQAKSQHALATTSSPTGQFTCLTCHVPVYKAGQPLASLLRVNGSWVCTVVTGVQPGDGFCYSCHGPGSTLPEGDLTSFEKTGHASIPAPATGAGVVCDACHESHSSRNEHLNKFSGLMMCMQCHTDTTANSKEPDIWTRLQLNEDEDAKHPLLAQDQADGARMECQNCHNTHTTTVAFPLVDPHNPSPSGTWTTSRGTEHVFCFTCHNGQPLPTSQETTPWAPPVLASGGATTVADIQTAWSTNVHGFGSRSSPTTTSLYLRPDMGYSYATTLECRACHDAHGTLNDFALQQNVVSASGNKTISGALVTKFTKSDGSSGYDLRFFCSTCHLWDSSTHDVASMADTSTVGFPMDCTACHRHFNLNGTPSNKL